MRFAPPAVPDEPFVRVYQMPAAGIQWLVALTEASDGIGLVRTLDEDRGIVECWIMPGFRETFERLLEDVGREYPMQALAREFD